MIDPEAHSHGSVAMWNDVEDLHKGVPHEWLALIVDLSHANRDLAGLVDKYRRWEAKVPSMCAISTESMLCSIYRIDIRRAYGLDVRLGGVLTLGVVLDDYGLPSG